MQIRPCDREETDERLVRRHQPSQVNIPTSPRALPAGAWCNNGVDRNHQRRHAANVDQLSLMHRLANIFLAGTALATAAPQACPALSTCGSSDMCQAPASK